MVSSPKSKALKTKLQITQSKGICSCLELPPCGHINPSNFRKINWLPVEHRVELCTSTTVFRKGIVPSYLNDIFMLSIINYNTRSQMALEKLLCRTIKWQKSMSFLGPKIWNKVSSNKKQLQPHLLSGTVWKKEFLVNCKSEQFYWWFFLLLLLLLFFFLIFWKLIFLLYFFVFIPLGEP